MTSAIPGILPTYQRFFSGVPGPLTRRSFRSRERYIIVLVFTIFGLMCFGTFFFLPEMRPTGQGAAERVYLVYDHLKKAGPQLLIPSPQPPPAPNNEESVAFGGGGMQLPSPFDGPQIYRDRIKLQAKIDEDTELKVLERPRFAVISSSSSTSSTPSSLSSSSSLASASSKVGPKRVTYPVDVGSLYVDSKTKERRNKIREMMQHAWSNYVRYAWGHNELKPISKREHTGSIFGVAPLGATILDGLDTLFIMGMEDEFNEARNWVANTLNVSHTVTEVSVFESNIRFVGGLLACYSLTGDTVFRDKAQQIADKLLPAFTEDYGIPYALINFNNSKSRNYNWASSGSSILSEFGTLHLEFTYLSDVTGNEIYRNKVDRIRHTLQTIERPNGLYPNFLKTKTGVWGQYHMSMGALGDSFYEYLLKAWIQSNHEDTEARTMFDEAMKAIFKHMLKVSPGDHLMYFAELKYDRVEDKMDHLACFSGGLLALAAQTLRNENAARYMSIAENITHTCHASYAKSATKLGPESFRFSSIKEEAKSRNSNERHYILRPEVIESYFYLYRYTRDEKYRDWGWQAAQAIEKYCRVEGGYSGIKNVYEETPPKDDVQQSYFIAETLKYLYLLFSDDTILPLDQWVYNTEAHPLPIKGVNPLYREYRV